MATTKPKTVAATKKAAKSEKKPARWTKPFRATNGYLVGSWEELRYVRWPDRKATWSLTIAVMVFSLLFALVILGLDWVFSYLFKEVLL